MNIRRDDYLQSIGTSYQEQRAQARTEAEQRIRRTFALNKLGELENIEVSEDDIDARVEELLTQDPESDDRRQQIEEQRESIERMLKYEKTISLLVTVAKGEAESSEQTESEDSAEQEGSENTDNDNEKTTTTDGGDDTDDSQA